MVKFWSKNRHMMVTSLPQSVSTAPLHLNLVNECLHRGEEAVALPPKSFAVLHYLVDHPGRLVWPITGSIADRRLRSLPSRGVRLRRPEM
jgi:hypothetical protein